MRKKSWVGGTARAYSGFLLFLSAEMLVLMQKKELKGVIYFPSSLSGFALLEGAKVTPNFRVMGAPIEMKYH